MNKRIRELVLMAYDTGYVSACIERADPRYANYDETQRRNIAERNAARDTLEVDIASALASLKAALELVHHDADTPRLHRAADMLDVAAAIMEGRDPSPWQELLAEDDY